MQKKWFHNHSLTIWPNQPPIKLDVEEIIPKKKDIQKRTQWQTKVVQNRRATAYKTTTRISAQHIPKMLKTN